MGVPCSGELGSEALNREAEHNRVETSHELFNGLLLHAEQSQTGATDRQHLLHRDGLSRFAEAAEQENTPRRHMGSQLLQQQTLLIRRHQVHHVMTDHHGKRGVIKLG